MATGILDTEMEVVATGISKKDDGFLINDITLTNQKPRMRHCLICHDEFMTTVGGPHVCPKKHCQKTLSRHSPKVYSVSEPAADLLMPREILSAEQQNFELQKTPIHEIRFVLKVNDPKTSVKQEVVRFLEKKKGDM